MGPIGFESSKNRLGRALLVGAFTGSALASAVTATAYLLEGTDGDGIAYWYLAQLIFVIGFASGFLLRLTAMEYAPPQHPDDGDENAGVPARLVPPLTPLSARRDSFGRFGRQE